MLEFKPLSLKDKDFFDKYLKPYKFATSEYSFINLFIWRKACDIRYTVYKDVIIIKKKDFNNNYHFMQPIGYNMNNLKEIVSALIDYKEENSMNFLFKDIETSFINDLQQIYVNKFEFEEDIDNFDYIYESSKLMTLSGKKLHNKKNHYNNFVKNNEYRTAEINDENINECIKAAKEWVNVRDAKGYLLYELEAIEEMLLNRSILGFDGMAVYVDEKLSAFTIGEKINEDMAIVYIEKADSEINGLYTFINKTFIENHYSEIPYINREQDLGIQGLRQAKKTYYPFKLEQKYNVK